jgi:ADP-ribosylglycohydrolase
LEQAVPARHRIRLARARCSLEGLSVGDAFGERFFLHPNVVDGLTAQRALPAPPWRFTDDTQMALSIVAELRDHGGIEQDDLARSFGEGFDHMRGYGLAMHHLLPRLGAGEPWQELAPRLFGGQGSFGNGAAMRVAPVGGYFADDLDLAAKHARSSAEVTHAHPEAVAGAIAVAVAAAWAWRLRRASPRPIARDFLGLVLPHVPETRVRDGIERARELPPDASVDTAVEALGNGVAVTAQETVPFVLWCTAHRLGDYVEALWLTVSGLGDVDTTCAMVGGIVALSTGLKGIPPAWRRHREPLPAGLAAGPPRRVVQR